jgi:hypothetical protein
VLSYTVTCGSEYIWEVKKLRENWLSSSIALRASFKYIIKTMDYKERGDNDVIYKKHGGTPDQ